MSQKICHEIMIFRRPFNQNQHTDQLVISANECMKRRMINIILRCLVNFRFISTFNRYLVNTVFAVEDDVRKWRKTPGQQKQK